MTNNSAMGTYMKNRTALLIAFAAFLLTVTIVLASRRSRGTLAAENAPTARHQLLLVAGPGRVEPYSEDIKIGSELSGRLKLVKVEEGDVIQRGEVLAELENADYRAQVESARANVGAKEATLRKVINGARRQERNEAWSSVSEAKAVMENAQSELRRREELFSAGVVSRSRSCCSATSLRNSPSGVNSLRSTTLKLSSCLDSDNGISLKYK